MKTRKQLCEENEFVISVHARKTRLVTCKEVGFDKSFSYEEVKRELQLLLAEVSEDIVKNGDREFSYEIDFEILSKQNGESKNDEGEFKFDNNVKVLCRGDRWIYADDYDDFKGLRIQNHEEEEPPFE